MYEGKTMKKGIIFLVILGLLAMLAGCLSSVPLIGPASCDNYCSNQTQKTDPGICSCPTSTPVPVRTLTGNPHPLMQKKDYAVISLHKPSGGFMILDVTNGGSVEDQFIVYIKYFDKEGVKFCDNTVVIPPLAPGETGHGKSIYPAEAGKAEVGTVVIKSGENLIPVYYTADFT